MADNQKLEGTPIENLEALTYEFSLEDLAQFDDNLKFELSDLEASKPAYTTKQKLKMILMNNMVFSIIKWCFAALGIVGAVFYALAMSSTSMSENLTKTVSKGVRGGLTAISNMLPFSLMEILFIVVVVGILGYIGFLIYKTIKEKELLKIIGHWVQLVYVLLAVFGTTFLLYTLCYGVTTNRTPLYKSYLKELYQPVHFTEQAINGSMLYYTDMVNNVAVDGLEKQTIFYTANGHSRYASTGDSLDKICKTVNNCFNVAKRDKAFKFLGGETVTAKKLLLTPLYTAMGIGSIYCPFTGEVLINTDYPEVLIPMQIARGIAKQRGITNDDEASMVAFIVCTRYRDFIKENSKNPDKYNVDYVAYSAYLDAYLETGSVVYRMDKNRHLYCAAALKESAKKDVTAMVKKLDALYDNNSKLQFTPASEKTSTADYEVIAKLLYKDYNIRVDRGDIPLNYTATKPVPTKGSSAYCKYLVSYFYKEATGAWGQQVEAVYADRNPQPSLNDGTGN